MTQLQFNFDPGDQAERIAQAERRVLKALKDWALVANTRIGGTAVSKYMDNVAGVSGQSTFGAIQGKLRRGAKLRIITGRLARSILGSRKTFAQRMGGAVESIEEITTPRVGVVELTKGSKVPYAAIHEYGGKAGRGGRARIPRRSYLRPGLRDETSYLTGNLRDRIQQAISVI